MTNEMTIWGTFQFEGFHKWADAPPEHAFLSQLHRHQFHVRWEVKGDADISTIDGRPTEFIAMSREIKQFCEGLTLGTVAANWSCEHWAKRIGQQFICLRVEVSEDGENGATWNQPTQK